MTSSDMVLTVGKEGLLETGKKSDMISKKIVIALTLALGHVGECSACERTLCEHCGDGAVLECEVYDVSCCGIPTSVFSASTNVAEVQEPATGTAENNETRPVSKPGPKPSSKP
jgi:hypothetical protein